MPLDVRPRPLGDPDNPIAGVGLRAGRADLTARGVDVAGTEGQRDRDLDAGAAEQRRECTVWCGLRVGEADQIRDFEPAAAGRGWPRTLISRSGFADSTCRRTR